MNDLTYPGAWTSIQRTENGWVVAGPTGQEFPPASQYVFEDSHEEGGDRRSLSLALWQAIEFLQAHGSRYDKERVNIVLEPGDKYEDHGITDVPPSAPTWDEIEGAVEEERP